MRRSSILGLAIVLVAGLPAWGQSGLVISEIMYNPESPEDAWEWIEIANLTDTAVDLAGWVLDDNNGTAVVTANILTGTVPPGGCAVLFNAEDLSSSEFAAAWPEVHSLIPVFPWAAGGLNNGGDAIGLWASFGDYEGDHEDHDHVALGLTYDDTHPWPGDDGAASIQLLRTDLDPTDGANWALSAEGDALGSRRSTATATNNGLDVGRPGVVRGALFADGFEGGHAGAWSAAVPPLP